jgi:glutathione S-transferase
MSLVLYGNRESGHYYKVRLFLTLANIAHEFVAVDIFGPRSERAADFRAVSTYGEVPVLVENGTPIVQSDAILLHLARQTGQFGPPLGASWDDVTTWLFWEVNRISFGVSNLRYESKFAKGTPAAVLAWLEARAIADLDRLDAELTGRTFLLGETPCIADLACCSYLFFADQAGLDITRWPHVVAWLSRLRALPRFQEPYALTP